MSDFNPNKLLVNLIRYLNNTKQSELAALLPNAILSIETTMEHDDYESYEVKTLSVKLPNRVVHLYDSEDDPMLIAAIQRLLAIRVSSVSVLSLLDDDDEPLNEIAGSTLYAESGAQQSVFGKPLVDNQFDCDIFVIMPFADEFTAVYEDIIHSAVTPLRLTIKRGDDPFTTSPSIMQEIWSMLNACHLVIADCSGHNPNVFYELGIAHTLGKPVVLITQDISNQPFDIRGTRAIAYSTHIKDRKQSIAKITEAIQKLTS